MANKPPRNSSTISRRYYGAEQSAITYDHRTTAVGQSLLSLPLDVLLCILDQCFSTFSNHELWFNLSRVCRLFRQTVESFVVRPIRGENVPLRDNEAKTLASSGPLHIKIGFYDDVWPQPAISDHWESTTDDIPHSGDRCYIPPAEYRNIDATDLNRLVLLIKRADRFIDGGTLANKLEIQWYCTHSSHKPNPKLPKLIPLGTALSWRRVASPIPPPIVGWELPRDSNDYPIYNKDSAYQGPPFDLEITYDWRRLWTLRCAYLRQLEDDKKNP